jgi:hypothetical protein
MAAASFPRDYERALAGLTFSSKPVINTLTQLADENRAHAQAVVDSVLRRCGAGRGEDRLPVWHLLDSVRRACPLRAHALPWSDAPRGR